MKRIDVSKAFPSDEQRLAYLEKMRWPDGHRTRNRTWTFVIGNQPD
jgi:hypothetical protein